MSQSDVFRLAPLGALQLPGDMVHVWRIPLDRTDRELDALHRLLSPDELTRSKRFRFRLHRYRYLAGRGALRLILSRYLEESASAIRFAYGPHGKPALADHDLLFNLAHSEGMALCAVSRRGPLGVDIERKRPLTDAERIADQFFSPPERAAWRCVPLAERDAAFFRCWTRKEAYLKALGHGLAVPPASFSVTMSSGEVGRHCRLSDVPSPAANWMVYHVEPGPEYIGAVVQAGAPSFLCNWQWDLTWAQPL